ncbi:MAG TPA: RNA polymerase sigma factor [Jatrophihabitantaceae bacterium]
MLARDFAAVLEAAAGGDETAFAKLWRDVHPALLRYLRVVTKDQTLAEDVAADVWVDVARRLDAFVGDESAFRGWLFTLARRRAIDAWRQAQRAPVHLTGDDADLDRPGEHDTAGSALERMGTQRALALLATLPREQAEVIALRVIAGLDVKEVAHLLGKRPGAVRVAAHRGLRTLAARFTSEPRPTAPRP